MDTFDGSAIWEEALNQARKDISEQEFLMWFRLSYERLENGVMTVKAPNTFLRDQFTRKYIPYMQNVLKSLTELDIKLVVSAFKPDIAGGQDPAERDPAPAKGDAFGDA
ncbi:MAG: hypothetical protein LWX00_06325, partial [Spirochaetia bacterium]|nr:hypothetical protein [Spirochaetia bacterium]